MRVDTSAQPSMIKARRRKRFVRQPATTVTRFYVTASHTVRGSGVLRAKDVPFAEGHIREVGGEFTACGRPALYWPILWDLTWDEVSNPCPDCAYQIAAARLVTPD